MKRHIVFLASAVLLMACGSTSKSKDATTDTTGDTDVITDTNVTPDTSGDTSGDTVSDADVGPDADADAGGTDTDASGDTHTGAAVYVEVAMGMLHTCGRKDDSTVVCVGRAGAGTCTSV